jgi:hypothetical protein
MGAEARHNIQLGGGATDAQVLCFDPIVQWIDQVMKCFMIVTWRLDMPEEITVYLRGEQNDYSLNFVDSGRRPQNFIPEVELTSVVLS